MQVIERKCKLGLSFVYPSVDANERVDDVFKYVSGSVPMMQTSASMHASER